jgi:hypothetical protein
MKQRSSGSYMAILNLIWKFRIINGNSGIWDMGIPDKMEITLLILKFRLLPESYPKRTRKIQIFKYISFSFKMFAAKFLQFGFWVQKTEINFPDLPDSDRSS